MSTYKRNHTEMREEKMDASVRKQSHHDKPTKSKSSHCASATVKTIPTEDKHKYGNKNNHKLAKDSSDEEDTEVVDLEHTDDEEESDSDDEYISDDGFVVPDDEDEDDGSSDEETGESDEEYERMKKMHNSRNVHEELQKICKSYGSRLNTKH